MGVDTWLRDSVDFQEIVGYFVDMTCLQYK